MYPELSNWLFREKFLTTDSSCRSSEHEQKPNWYFLRQKKDKISWKFSYILHHHRSNSCTFLHLCCTVLHLVLNFGVAEVLQNMYCISSATEYVIMKVSQNIPIYTYSTTLAYNLILILIYLKTPALECIFRDTWSWNIFSSSTLQITVLYLALYSTSYCNEI